MKKKILKPMIAIALVSAMSLSMGACTSSKDKKMAKAFNDISAYDSMISELLEDVENATFAESMLGTFTTFQDEYPELTKKYEAMEEDIPDELTEYYNATKNYMEAFATAGVKLQLLYQFGHSNVDLSEVKVDQAAVDILQTQLISKYGFKENNSKK